MDTIENIRKMTKSELKHLGLHLENKDFKEKL